MATEQTLRMRFRSYRAKHKASFLKFMAIVPESMESIVQYGKDTAMSGLPRENAIRTGDIPLIQRVSMDIAAERESKMSSEMTRWQRTHVE